MENKKYILGLDVSTSCIGVTIFEDLGDCGELVVLNHLEPKVKTDTYIEKLIAKAELCINKLYENYKDFNIVRIIIEKPLKNSKNQKTALMLEMFNEYFSHHLGLKFGLEVEFITVHNARKYGLPELLGDNGRMWSDFPKKVANMTKGKWSKFLIMYLVSQRYKNVVWLLNNNLKISKKNFDRADAIVAVLGYMVLQGHWEKMGNHDYWQNIDVTKERCVEIIEKNVAYEKFCKEHVDGKKEYKPKEKKKIKQRYLKEHFKIKEFINVEY